MAAKFSQEVFDAICERLADGESLRAICADADMPNKGSVFRWLANDTKLSDQYARAREEQGDLYFDDVVRISDEATPENVQVARLQINSRKWAAGKLRPKVYGEKLDLNHGGSFNVVISGDDADL